MLPIIKKPNKARRIEKEISIFKKRRNKLKEKIKFIKYLQPGERNYSFFLAKEILITETFVNRIQRESKKDVVVVGVKRTGVPYTWSIRPSEHIKLEPLKYPSYDYPIRMNSYKERVKEMMAKYDDTKTIFIFVDASQSPRMPSSFIGNHMGINFTDSINYLLKSKNPKLVGYDRTMQDGTTKLPHYKDINSNVILFNPTNDRDTLLYKGQDYVAARHDDNPSLMSERYKRFVINQVNKFKKGYAKSKRNNTGKKQ